MGVIISNSSVGRPPNWFLIDKFAIIYDFREAIDKALRQLKKENKNFKVYGLVQLRFKNVLTKFVKGSI